MATMYLTDSLVRGLEANGGRHEVWDTVLPGLGLRYSSRKKTWFFVFHSPQHLDGKGYRRRCRMTLGDFPKKSLAEVRAEAAALREAVQQGIDPSLGRRVRKERSFRNLAEEYVERQSKPNKTRWDHDVCVLRSALYPAFEHRVVSSITAKEIRDLAAVWRQRGPWVAVRALSVLRSILQFGVEAGELPANPAHGIVSAIPPSRSRVLTREEVRWMWEACAEASSPWALLLPLRLATAQRGTQLRQLKVSDLERDASGLWWNVPAAFTKTRKPYRVFLSPLAEELLGRRSPDALGAYFPKATTPEAFARIPTKLLAQLKAAAGGRDWQPLDLRRTAATWMAQRGVPRFVLKRVLGHADHDITAVYDLYSYDREVKAAVLILEQAIREAIGQVPPAEPVAIEPMSFQVPGSSPFFPQFPGLPR